MFLTLFALGVCCGTALFAEEFRCEGVYPHHLQGFAADEDEIYWSFTSVLMKSDKTGKKLMQIDVPMHHGDCCVVDGKLYVSTHLRWPREDAESWIYVYNCADLKFEKKIPLPEYNKCGVDGITFHDGFFYVCLGKDPKDTTPFNIVCRMTPDFELVEKIKVPGETVYGIQACSWANGGFWLGTYGKAGTIQCDANLNVIADNFPDMSTGVYALPPTAAGETRLMVAQHRRDDGDPAKNWALVRSAVLKNGKLEWEGKD